MNPELLNKLKKAKTARLLQDRLDRELYIGIEDVKDMASQVDNIIQIDELIQAMGVSVISNITLENGIFVWKFSEKKKMLFFSQENSVGFDDSDSVLKFIMTESITNDLIQIKKSLIKLLS